MNIVFCSSEIIPFAKTGGLGDVCGSLPLALEKLGHDLCLVMPLYRQVEKGKWPRQPLAKGFSTATVGKNIKVLFIENSELFGRPGVYGDGKNDYPDNLERFRFFCWQTFQGLKALKFKPDVLHCHDWQAALIPAYRNFKFYNDPFFQQTRTVLTIHNLAFQGVFPSEQYPRLNLDSSLFTTDGFEYYGNINLLKAGILYSDMVTTVSPRYAQEIQTKEFGCGLDGVIRSRRKAVLGILNGIDYDIWNPRTDTHLETTYDAADLEGKRANKAALQKAFGFDPHPEIPLFGFVGRLTHQKGVDLLLEALPSLTDVPWQMILLGEGDGALAEKWKAAVKKNPKRLAVQFEFNEDTARRIYAASDLFLMPSAFEPCGLSQMISLRYGTIPLVHHVGGLVDTIQPFQKGGNGFVFTEHKPKALSACFHTAVRTFHDVQAFAKLQKRAFEERFPWDDSAKKYEGVYEKIPASQETLRP